MKIVCNVSVEHRVQVQNTISRGRSQRSALSLVINPKDKNEVFIIHQSAKGSNGMKYKILGNIENVFTKCLPSGKATIRLKVPAVDLCIQCDTIQLKCFLQKLKLVLQGKDPSSLSVMTVSASTQVTQAPKTKFVVTDKKNYNLCAQLPRTLEIVKINNIMSSHFDRRIFKLQNLQILNLENNAIETIPDELGNLPLKELYLGSNNLGAGLTHSKWKWLLGNNIQSKLALLQLENNKLTAIPNEIIRLRKLVTLKLHNNFLAELPMNIGNLSELKNLTVSDNKLMYLPFTLGNIRFSQLDLSSNPFLVSTNLSLRYTKDDFIHLQSLLESAALKVIESKEPFLDMIIPTTLKEYLSSISRCHCRKPSFRSKPAGYMYAEHLLQVASIVKNMVDRPVVKFHYCSYNCFKKRSIFFRVL